MDSMDTSDRTYGGCEGPDAMYVKLISSDGHEFIIKREHALTSGTIKAMLSGPGQFAENETNEVFSSIYLLPSDLYKINLHHSMFLFLFYCFGLFWPPLESRSLGLLNCSTAYRGFSLWKSFWLI